MSSGSDCHGLRLPVRRARSLRRRSRGCARARTRVPTPPARALPRLSAIVGERIREADSVGVTSALRAPGESVCAIWVTSPDSSSVPSCPWAAVRISRAWPVALSAALVLLVTLCWKIAPSPAIPVAIPTWRKVRVDARGHAAALGWDDADRRRGERRVDQADADAAEHEAGDQRRPARAAHRRRSSPAGRAPTSSEARAEQQAHGDAHAQLARDRRDDERQQRDRQEAQARPAAG